MEIKKSLGNLPFGSQGKRMFSFSIRREMKQSPHPVIHRSVTAVFLLYAIKIKKSNGRVKMQKDFQEVKLNIPKSNKRVVAYCKKLASRRQLSATVIRLLSKELDSQENKSC